MIKYSRRKMEDKSLINQAEIIRENRKTLKIVIQNTGNLVVFCPKNISIDKINEILQAKQSLLCKKLEKAKNINLENIDILNYKAIFLLGKKYKIIEADKICKPYFTNEFFFIPEKYTIKTDSKIKIINKTLKNIALSIIENRAKEIINLYHIKRVKKISIGSFKSKWGSCDSEGHIKFNWKMIMLAPQLIDFIIYHELSHLKELNHSKQFYAVLSNFLPNHRKYRNLIKSYSFLLNI